MLGRASTGQITFDGLLVVMVLAVVIPLALGLFPRLPLPGSVVEILAGIVIGPAVLGWVQPDRAIEVLAKLGRRVPAVPGRPRARLRPAPGPAPPVRAHRVRSVDRARPHRDGPARAHERHHRSTPRHDHPVCDVARHRHAGAQGRRPDRDATRHPGDRGVLGRGVRRDRAALDVLLGHRARPTRSRPSASSSCSGSRWPASRWSRRAPAVAAACTTSSAGCRTRARRSASGSRSSRCWPCWC